MVMAPVCQSAPCSGEVWRWCVRRRSVPTCGCQRSGELSFQHHGNRTSAIKTRRVLLRHSHVSSHYRGCLLLLPAPPTGQDETLILTVSCVRKNIYITIIRSVYREDKYRWHPASLASNIFRSYTFPKLPGSTSKNG